ncbi:gas vesicle protein G [Mycobacterium sp. 1164966.3]|uniref:gas vesicle protein GvpG n=1 Tax=Mycobacterium sp. 1164966.3 TaxID=1856861 RepID=UPI0008018F0F|nr:gas vesicle protein GvpG [Mycobacterium sp. 1164966.3]OBA82136.1 gas vesicle protein G [Mycobacterium sp. 1164966.3]
MGLFSGIVLLPLAPVRGVIRLAEVIQEHVEQELHNPAHTRRKLEELAQARERGEISADEERQLQRKILEPRVKPANPDTPAPEED